MRNKVPTNDQETKTNEQESPPLLCLLNLKIKKAITKAKNSHVWTIIILLTRLGVFASLAGSRQTSTTRRTKTETLRVFYQTEESSTTSRSCTALVVCTSTIPINGKVLQDITCVLSLSSQAANASLCCT